MADDRNAAKRKVLADISRYASSGVADGFRPRPAPAPVAAPAPEDDPAQNFDDVLGDPALLQALLGPGPEGDPAQNFDATLDNPELDKLFKGGR